MSDYRLYINGVEQDILKDSLDVDWQVNWQSTLACQIPVALVGSPILRAGVRDDVLLKRDGTAIFGGYLSQAPEQGLGGPNLDQIVMHVSAVGYGIVLTYRYPTVTFSAGATLKSCLITLSAYLPTGFTLDPSQPTGPTLTDELVFTRTRLDNILKALADATGYLPQIDPAKIFSMISPATVPAPFDILDSGPTGTGGLLYQIGDLRVERTVNEDYANRIIAAVTGAGPATSTEYFVTPGSTWSYTTKYPASLSVMDLWPNELWVNEPGSPDEWIPYGPIGFGASPITNWDPVTHTLTYTGTGGIPPTGSLIRVAYAISYPFFVEGNDLTDQATHPIKEAYVKIPEAMTLEAAQAFVDQLATERAAGVERVLYTTEVPGLFPGMAQTITVAARDIDAACLITEVKLRVPAERPGSEPVYDVTALVGAKETGNVRTVYRSWLEDQRGGIEVTGSKALPGFPVRSAQFHGPNDEFRGTPDVLIDDDGTGDLYGNGTGSFAARLAALVNAQALGDYSFVVGNRTAGLGKALTFSCINSGEVYLERKGSGGGIRIYEQTEDMDLQAAKQFRIVAGAADTYALKLQGLSAINGLCLGTFEITTDPFTIDASLSSVVPVTTHLWNRSSAGTVTLPALAAFNAFPATGLRRLLCLKNIGSAVCTIDANSTELIYDGTTSALTLALYPGQAVWLHAYAARWEVVASHGRGALQFDVTLTDAQIKALPTTPITLIAAPGSGLRIKLRAATISINNGTADYTNIDGTYSEIALRFNNGGSPGYLASVGLYDDPAYALTQITDFLAGVNGRKYVDLPVPYFDSLADPAFTSPYVYTIPFSSAAGSTQTDNKAVELFCVNAAGNFTGGNSAQIMRVTGDYRVEALAA